MEDVWDGIRSQPGRTSLSFLAIAIGTIALTILLAALFGLREKAHHLVEELGANVAAIISPRRAQYGANDHGMDEYRARVLAASLPQCRVATARFFPPSPSDSANLLRIAATDENLRDVRQWRLLRGRFIDAWDVRTFARNSVLTEDLARIQGWELGQVITLRSTPFRVVGIVAADTESLETENTDVDSLSGKRTAFIPRTTARQWQDAGAADLNDLDAVFVRAREGTTPAGVLSASQRVLSAPDTSCSGCLWITPEKLLVGVRRLERTILLTVGAVSLLCLVLGGTTLGSLMVANVRDRIPEIGLRRALGAQPQDIAALFVMEGVLVAGAAAVIGMAASHVFLFSTRALLPCPIKMGGATVLIPIILSVMVGAFASYRPARSAAVIAPAEALRSE